MIKQLLNKYKSKKMKKEQKYWIYYLICFVSSFTCFFFLFYVKGVSFVRYGDAYYQHLPALEYYSEWLKVFIRNLFSGNSIPSYSLSLGYGGDVLTTLNYYCAGDPLNILVVFANKYTIVYFYDALIILRLFLSGVFFSFLLKEKGHRLDLKALCGTLVYCFSGWAIVAPLTHIFFGTILMYLPLLIIGSTRIIEGKSNTIFIISVFLLAISNFYYLYVGILSTGIYVIVELLTKKDNIRSKLNCIIRYVVSGVIGLLLAAPILLPVCIAVINSTRTSKGINISLFYNLEYYIHILKNFFLYNSNDKWLVLGFSPIVFASIIHALYSKKKQMLYVILCIICMAIPFLGSAFNGFSYSSNKWLAANSLVLATSVTHLLSDTRSKTENIVISVLTFTFLIINACMMEESWTAVFILGIISVCALFVAEIKRFKDCFVYNILILFLCIVPMCYTWNQGIVDVDNKYMTKDVLTNTEKYYWDTNDAQLIKEMEGNPIESFYRFTGDIRYNLGINNGMSSTSAYWSVLDKGYMDFYNELAIIENSSYNQVKGVDNRTGLYYLSNSRYTVSTQKDLPYGVVPTKTGRIYKSIKSLPFGYSYREAINAYELSGKNPLEKELLMLRAAIIDDKEGAVLEGLSESDYPAITYMPYSVELSDDVSYEDKQLIILNDGGKIILKLDGCKEGGELGIYIEGIDCKSDLSEMPIDVSFFSDNLLLSKKTLKYTTPNNHWYSGRHDFYISSGYHELPVDRVELVFEHSETYRVECLSVLLNSDPGIIETAIDDLSEHSLNNVNFNCQNQILAINQIKAEFSADENRLVCLTIPFSKGWKLYVDGKEEPTFKTNYMFTGFIIHPGEHAIELRYQTPGLMLGIIIFFIMLLLIFTNRIIRKYKTKRKYSC